MNNFISEGFTSFTKNNVTCELIVRSLSNKSLVGNGDLIGTIQAGLRPKVGFMVNIYDYSTSKPLNGSVFIGQGGDVKYYGDSITNKEMVFNGTWLAAI